MSNLRIVQSLNPASDSSLSSKSVSTAGSAALTSISDISAYSTSSTKFSARSPVGDAGGASTSGTFLKPGYDYSGRYRPQSKEYYFMGSMSEELLHRYLSRSIIMQGMSNNPDEHLDAPQTVEEHDEVMAMLRDIQPKVIVDMVWSWGGWWEDNINKQCAQLKKDIDTIHSYDADVLCGASIYEYVDDSCRNIKIPNWVKSAFADDFGGREVSEGADPNYFDNVMMRYWPNDLGLDIDRWRGMPSTSQLETQMWFYYLAVRFIDCGAEIIGIGDMFEMNKHDWPSGNKGLWKIVSKIREYGKTKNRGLVLIPGRWDRVKLEDGYGEYTTAYYDPLIDNIALPWERKLLFDFFSFLVPVTAPADRTKHPSAPSSWPCTPAGGFTSPGFEPLEFKVKVPGEKSFLVNDSPGGLNPLGWVTKHTPYVLLIDGGTSPKGDAGCGFPFYEDREAEIKGRWFYNWDDSSWFASQSDSFRNRFIKHLYYSIRCVDRNGHYLFHGRRGVTNFRNTRMGHTYRAETGYGVVHGNQQETIKCIWNGAYSLPPEWMYHNFSSEKIFNPANPANAVKSLTFAGTDKIFYIGSDGYVHGCVLYNGTWLGVSPSYAADIFYGQLIDSQVKAKSDLVASPDGKRLLYLGEDGEFHGFDVDDIWHYSYTGVFMRTPEYRVGTRRISTRRVVQNSVIYPGNDRIYYVDVMIDGSQRVHGFQKSSGTWQTVSPTYSAEIVFHQPVAGQFQAAGPLVYDSSTPVHRIYFPTTNGYLAYYEVVNLIDYRYMEAGNHHLTSQRIRIVGKPAVFRNRIYFAAIYNSDLSSRDSFRIHCLIDRGLGAWDTVSPSYSAQLHYGKSIDEQAKAYAANIEVAVSEDGNWIGYFGVGRGRGSYVFLFRNVDGVKYEYNSLDVRPGMEGDNSLQFRDGDFFYLSSRNLKVVHHLIFEENYCKNPAVRQPY